jgi:uncharacterized phage-associated protein
MCYCNGYSGLAIADYFVKKALSEDKPITNMHVLKMIYFAQGFGFTELNRRLIKDDFYAWQWGPVEITTYETFRKYGGGSIKAISNKTNKELEDIEQQENIVAFLDKIYKLRSIDPFVLSEKTHTQGSPWAKTKAYDVIDINLIHDYFVK